MCILHAGTESHCLDPLAVQVMNEAGVDISGQKSKTVDEIAGIFFDYMATPCNHAQTVCPYFPARVRLIHKSFDDPPVCAARAKTGEEGSHHYRFLLFYEKFMSILCSHASLNIS